METALTTTTSSTPSAGSTLVKLVESVFLTLILVPFFAYCLCRMNLRSLIYLMEPDHD